MAENTPEKIAWDLMDKIEDAGSGEDKSVDKEWILRTYGQCLETVRNPHLVHEILPKFTG